MNYNQVATATAPAQPEDLRSMLSRLFSGWSVGKGAAPTIYENGGLTPDTVQRGQQAMMDTQLAARNAQAAAAPPMPMPPTDAQAQAQADLYENGPMNDANLPRFAPPPRAPGYDNVGMDALTAQLANPSAGITEGPNRNIGDDSRQRALEMVAALRRGGAL